MARQIKYALFIFFFFVTIAVSGVVSVYAALNGTAYNGYMITYEAETGLVLGDAETFQNNLNSSSITSVIFGAKSNYTSQISGATNVEDVSEYQDETIKRYLVGTTIYVLSESDEEMYMNQDSTSLFSGFSSATSFVFDNIDTSRTYLMESMFEGCSSLTSIDLSSFDTENVVKMDKMFYGCSNIETLNISSFNVTNNPTAVSFIDGATKIDTIITPAVSGSFSAPINNASANFYEVSGTTTQSQTAVTAINSSTSSTSKTLRRGYTVTFDVNGGNSVSSRVYTYGESLPASATRAGYTFGGWYSSETSNNGTGTRYTTCPDIGNGTSTLTVYAKWTAKEYSVIKTLSEGAASCTVNSTGTYGTGLSISWAGETHYDLTSVVIYGRPTAGSSTGEVVLQTITSGTSTTYTMSGTYYPQIRIAVNYQLAVTLYNITYDLQGGSAGTTSAQGAYGEIMPEIVFPSRQGYTFLGYTNTTTNLVQDRIGWNTTWNNLRVEYNIRDLSSGEQFCLALFTNQQPTNVTFNNVELTSAEWQCITYGSNYLNIIDMTLTDSHVSNLLALYRSLELSGIQSDVQYMIWASVKGGHYYYSQLEAVRNLDVESDITLYAQWTPDIYYVDYHPNGGTGNMSPTTHYYDTAANLTTNAFTRTGYTFSKWTEHQDGSGASYTDGQSVVNICDIYGGTVTLYAQWTPNVYSVTLNNHGATSAGTTVFYYKYEQSSPYYYYTNSACTTKLGANGYTITLPTKTGYTFGGYFTGENGTGTQYVNTSGTCINNIYRSVASNTTLHAKWTANHYTISYNGNGADSGSTPNSSHTYGVASSVSANGFVKADKQLKEWNTQANGSGTSIAPDGTVSTLSATDGAVVPVYAIWEDKTYKITFDANAGRGNLPYMADGNYSGNNMTISYDATNHRFTLTNSASSDPFATIGTPVYFTGNTTYMMHMQINDINGNPITTGSIQVFYAIDAAYNESQSMRFTNSNSLISFTPSTTGNYYLRIDNDTGVQVVIIDFWFLTDYEDEKQVAYNATYGTLPSPTKIGYTFDGWYTEKSGGTKITASSTHTVKAEKTYYGHWTPVSSYVVTANANGGTIPSTSGWSGTGATATKTVTFDSQYGTLPTPTHANDAVGTNYVFTGWYTATSGGTRVQATDIFAIVGGTTIYAQWTYTIRTYTVSFSGSIYVQGGDNCSSYEMWNNADSNVYSTSSLTVAYGTVIEIKIGAHGYWGWGTYVNSTITGASNVANEAAANSATSSAWWMGDTSGNGSTWKINGSGTRLVSKSTGYGWYFGRFYIVVRGDITIANSAGRN